MEIYELQENLRAEISDYVRSNLETPETNLNSLGEVDLLGGIPVFPILNHLTNAYNNTYQRISQIKGIKFKDLVYDYLREIMQQEGYRVRQGRYPTDPYTHIFVKER